MNDMKEREKRRERERREREREEREREKRERGERKRENVEIERKVKKLKENTEEAACSETAIKFNIDSLCPKFLHLSMHLSLRVT